MNKGCVDELVDGEEKREISGRETKDGWQGEVQKVIRFKGFPPGAAQHSTAQPLQSARPRAKKEGANANQWNLPRLSGPRQVPSDTAGIL